MSSVALPQLQDLFTLDAFLLAALVVLFTMPSIFRVTGGYVSGTMQMFVHGLVIFYFYIWLLAFIPGRKFGMFRSPAEINNTGGQFATL